MSLPQPPQPLPDAHELHRWVLDDVQDLQVLRDDLLTVLHRHRLTIAEALDERIDRIALLASELAINAIVQGCAPSIIRLLLADGCFILDVADHDLSPHTPPPDAGPCASDGRGLLLARQLSLDVSWYLTGTASHIWASFPARAPRVA
jgi:serine/threonine-protein kinase RsbW